MNMYLDLDQGQRELAAAVRDVAEGTGGLDVLREAWQLDGEQFETGQREKFGELGLFQLLAGGSEGLGLGAVELVAVARELGSGGCPGPVVAHMVYLPAIADALSASESDALFSGAAGLAANDGGLDTIVRGRWADVLLVHQADRIRVHRRNEVSVEFLESIDEARGSLAITAGTPFLVLDVDPDVSRTLVNRMALGAAAQSVGWAERMLSLSVDYASTREQFGVPIGSFQAVQHRLVDVRVALDRAWPALLAAAHLSESGAEDDVDVSVARVLADEAADLAAHACLQTHGAMGYTREYPLHMLCSAVWGSRGDGGTRDQHLARIESMLFSRTR